MAKKLRFQELIAPGENPAGVFVSGAEGYLHGGLGDDYYRQTNPMTNTAGPRWGYGGMEQPMQADHGMDSPLPWGVNPSRTNPLKSKPGK